MNISDNSNSINPLKYQKQGLKPAVSAENKLPSKPESPKTPSAPKQIFLKAKAILNLISSQITGGKRKKQVKNLSRPSQEKIVSVSEKKIKNLTTQEASPSRAPISKVKLESSGARPPTMVQITPTSSSSETRQVKASAPTLLKGQTTPLHEAASKGDIAGLRQLISEGQISLNSQDDNGNTPLILACFKFCQNPEAIKLLLEAGADPMIKNNKGINPTFVICEKGPADILGMILKSHDIKPEPIFTTTYYDLAMHNPNLKKSRELQALKDLDKGFTPEMMFRKELAHRFSLTGDFELNGVKIPRGRWSSDRSGQALAIKTAAFYQEIKQNIPSFKQKIRVSQETLAGIDKLGDAGLKQILDITQDSINDCLEFKKQSPDQILKRLEQGKPVSFLTGFQGEGHCVAIVIQRNSNGTYQISRCNKGMKAGKKPGIRVNDIGNPGGLLEAIKLIKLEPTSAYFNEGIEKQLDLKNEVYIRQKPQKTDNCTVANSNSMERAIIYMSLASKIGSKEAIEFSRSIQRGRVFDSKAGTLKEYLHYHGKAAPGSPPPDVKLLKDIYQQHAKKQPVIGKILTEWGAKNGVSF